MNDMIGRVLNELMVADNDKRDLKGFTSVKYIYHFHAGLGAIFTRTSTRPYNQIEKRDCSQNTASLQFEKLSEEMSIRDMRLIIP
jgi:hypothetical protein